MPLDLYNIDTPVTEISDRRLLLDCRNSTMRLEEWSRRVNDTLEKLHDTIDGRVETILTAQQLADARRAIDLSAKRSRDFAIAIMTVAGLIAAGVAEHVYRFLATGHAF
jgi:hypothetical protein